MPDFPETERRSTWSEYSRLVLSELARLDDDVKEMRKELAVMHGDLISLKIRAGLWGAIAGFIPSLIAAVVLWLKK